MAHHGIFRRLASADAVVMRLNLLPLMLVAFLPFPTKVVAEAIDRTTAERAAVIFYGLVLLAILAPQVAAFGFLLIAVVGVFRQRGDRAATSGSGIAENGVGADSPPPNP